MAILSLQHVTYCYNPDQKDAFNAVDDVTLDIEQGEFIGLIGPTGSGKSTLVQHLNGLLAPTKGEVLFRGQNMAEDKKKLRELRFKVGLVFQYPEYQLFEETVYKDIAFGPGNMGLDEKEIDRRVRQAAQFVGLKESYLTSSPFELSGGQKRRVAIAGVIAMEPEVLILDEPTAGLDPHGRDKILSQIDAFHKNTGTTVVLVSHSMEDIARYADRVLVLQGGKVALFDYTKAVFGLSGKLKEMGLSIPEITATLLELKQRGVPVRTDLYTVEDTVAELARVWREKRGDAHA